MSLASLNWKGKSQGISILKTAECPVEKRGTSV